MPELNSAVFIIPGQCVKNREDRLIVLNTIANAVIDKAKRQHAEYVVTYKGNSVKSINNSSWKRIRSKVGLDKVRVHDLKHTFGRRLRAAGVPLETRKVLLGHRNGDITTHYSAPELSELILAANKVCSNAGKMPAAGPAEHHSMGKFICIKYIDIRLYVLYL